MLKMQTQKDDLQAKPKHANMQMREKLGTGFGSQ